MTRVSGLDQQQSLSLNSRTRRWWKILQDSWGSLSCLWFACSCWLNWDRQLLSMGASSVTIEGFPPSKNLSNLLIWSSLIFANFLASPCLQEHRWVATRCYCCVLKCSWMNNPKSFRFSCYFFCPRSPSHSLSVAPTICLILMIIATMLREIMRTDHLKYYYGFHCLSSCDPSARRSTRDPAAWRSQVTAVESTECFHVGQLINSN